MTKQEIQEILEEESEMPKCICCGAKFITSEDELVCPKCSKNLSDSEYNILTGKAQENIRKNRKKQN